MARSVQLEGFTLSNHHVTMHGSKYLFQIVFQRYVTITGRRVKLLENLVNPEKEPEFVEAIRQS